MFVPIPTAARRALALAILAISGIAGSARAQPAIKSHCAELGAEPIAMDTAEFRELPVNDTAQLSTLIRDQKISAD